MPAPLRCTKCLAALPLAAYNAPGLAACPSCSSRTRVVVFPAFLREQETVMAERLLDETEGSCFYHPAKKAVVACESCGRFLCALCEVELDGAHLCPLCVESGKRKGKLVSLENRRTLYDGIALITLLMGTLICYFSIFTAPAALYLCLRHRNAPRSIVRPRRWLWWVVFLLALLETLAWLVGGTYLLSKWLQ